MLGSRGQRGQEFSGIDGRVEVGEKEEEREKEREERDHISSRGYLGKFLLSHMAVFSRRVAASQSVR